MLNPGGVPGLEGVPGPEGCLLQRDACFQRGCACSGGGQEVPVLGAAGDACFGGACSGGCLVETPLTATTVGSSHPTGMHSY